MKRNHMLEERRKLVNPDVRKFVTEVFDRNDAASDANDELLFHPPVLKRKWYNGTLLHCNKWKRP